MKIIPLFSHCLFDSLSLSLCVCLPCSHIVSLTISVCLSPLHFLLCTDFKGLTISHSFFRFFGGRSMLGTGLSMLLSAGAFFFFAVTGTWGMLFNIIFLFSAGAFNAGPDSILGERVHVLLYIWSGACHVPMLLSKNGDQVSGVCAVWRIRLTTCYVVCFS